MSEPLIERIESLKDGDFRVVVDCELRNQITPELLDLVGASMPPAPPKRPQDRVDPRVRIISDALASPILVDRWHEDLVLIKRNSENQLAAKRADDRAAHIDPDYPALHQKFLKDRAGTLRFLNYVDGRLAIAKRAMGRNSSTARAFVLERERNQLAAQVEALLVAIERHRDATDESDARAQDKELWGIVP